MAAQGAALFWQGIKAFAVRCEAGSVRGRLHPHPAPQRDRCGAGNVG